MKDPVTQAKKSPRWIGISLPITSLQLIAGFDGGKCPICQGSQVQAHIKEHYRPYCAPHIIFPKMDMLKCQNCGAKFFSDKQVRAVRRMIVREANKQKLPLANQKKLRREQDYYYGL